MSGREAFEAWAKGHGAVPADLRQTPSGDYITSIIDATWHAWSARDAELAAKDARIAGLEAALRNIKGLPRFDYLGFPSHDGDWLVPADVDDIIEEALR